VARHGPESRGIYNVLLADHARIGLVGDWNLMGQVSGG